MSIRCHKQLASPSLAPVLLTLLFSLSLASFGAAAADLTVEVEGAESGRGHMAVAVFDSAADFPDKFAHGQRLKIASGGTAVAVFKDLRPGRYAVSVYHDENDNEKLDRGLFGVPKERYGFSEDARGAVGPPQFREAAFQLPEQGARITVRVR
jgi:uncharacterized protein (DUF2141 family)